jgi:hypothetical protein
VAEPAEGRVLGALNAGQRGELPNWLLSILYMLRGMMSHLPRGKWREEKS